MGRIQPNDVEGSVLGQDASSMEYLDDQTYTIGLQMIMMVTLPMMRSHGARTLMVVTESTARILLLRGEVKAWLQLLFSMFRIPTWGKSR